MRLLVAFALSPLLILGPRLPRAEEEPSVLPSTHALARVAVVRQPGMQTYEELIEEFRGQVRAAVRVVPARHGERDALQGWLKGYRPAVVLAVGQSAYEQVRGLGLPIVSALALRRRAAGQAEVSTAIPLISVLAAFRVARPGTDRIGALHGRTTAAEMKNAQAEAALLGIEVITEQAASPADAISRLRRLAVRVQGLWLVPDLEVLSSQVLQYALMLQFRRRMPLLGATRRHASQGALLALDHDPADLGRQAALIANHLLAGEPPAPTSPPSGKLTVNLTTANRIGMDSLELRRYADRVLW